MSTYFGICNSDGTPLSESPSTFFYSALLWWPSVITGSEWTCPGSGAQAIDQLGVYARSRSGTTTARIGIYDADGNLICEGASALNITNTSFAWCDHTTFTGTPSLTGGTKYRIAVATADAYLEYAYATGAGGDWKSAATDYTAGLPATLPAGGSESYHVYVRCGVTPSAPAYRPRVTLIL